MADKKKMADKADKRKRARVMVGRGADGSPVYKWVSGKTKAELNRAIEEIKFAYRSGTDTRWLTFGTYAKQWYAQHTAGLSTSIKASYKSSLNKHILPAIGHVPIIHINHSQLQGLINSIDLSAGTVNQIRVVLRLIFHAAYMDKIIDFDPAADLIMRNKRRPPKRRSLTEDEQVLLLQASERAGTETMVYLLYYLGVRKGEAMGLRWEDVDWEEKEIHVERDIDPKTNEPSSTKTQTSVRKIPIPSPLYQHLRSVRGIGWILTGNGSMGQITHRQADYAWRKTINAMIEIAAEKEKKLECDSNGNPIYTPHYLRHTYASILYGSGVDVLDAQAWLGHANASTTIDIYTHQSKKLQQENTAKLDGVFSTVAKLLPANSKDI